MNNLNIWEQFIQQGQMRWHEVLEATSVHIQLVFFSMLIAIVLGITLGIFITRVPELTTVVLGGAGIMQTIPSLALLGFMIPIFGIGVKQPLLLSFYIHCCRLFGTLIQALKMSIKQQSKLLKEWV